MEVSSMHKGEQQGLQDVNNHQEMIARAECVESKKKKKNNGGILMNFYF